MSIRANSLPRVLLDGVFFVLAMGVASAAVAVFAQEPTPRTERVNDAVTDRRLTDDHIDSQLNTDDNPPSGDPAESPEAKREAMMLGMKLYEVETGNIRVDDVAATSPAWNAGIRKGDRLLAIDTLRPRSLAPWVQDVGKILTATEDGKSVAAAVERNGERLALRIRVPVSNAAAVRDARQEERAIANMAAGNSQQVQQLGQQGMVPATGGDTAGAVAPYGSGGYGGWGLGGFFDDRGNGSGTDNSDRIATTAVAQLMSVNTLDQGVPTGSTPAQGNTAPTQNMQTGGGRQIGLAAFQDNGQGIRAAVVVRGLPPGTYQVGIGPGGGLTGGTGTNAFGTGGQGGLNNQSMQDGNIGAGRDGIQGRNPALEIQRQGQPTGPGGVQPSMPVAPPGGTPAGGASPSGGAPAGGGGGDAGAGGASLANPNHVPILAQQLEAGESTQGAGAAAGNPSAVNPNQNLGAQGGNGLGPNQNAANMPQNANAQGNNFNDRGLGAANPASGLGGPPLGGGSHFVAEIGVLQVGQDGSGRVENQMEGMQVSNLAGMSVMVVSPLAQGTPLGQGGNAGGRFPAGSEGPQPIGGQADRDQNMPQQGIGGMNGVVATGTIQLVENNAAANSAFDASATQNDGRTPDTSGTEQLRDRNRTGPPADFNPRSPRQ